MIIFGSSCKAYALLECSDVHPRGPMPRHTECLCGACLKSSPATEYQIAHSEAPPPTEPEVRIAQWRATLEQGGLTPEQRQDIEGRIGGLLAMIDAELRPTKYVPDPALKGGTESKARPTRRQRRAADAA